LERLFKSFSQKKVTHHEVSRKTKAAIMANPTKMALKLSKEVALREKMSGSLRKTAHHLIKDERKLAAKKIGSFLSSKSKHAKAEKPRKLAKHKSVKSTVHAAHAAI